MSPLHERLSLLEAALGASRRSRRRRRRLSTSSSDGEYSGGDGGLQVPRRAVARALGRELEGAPHRRLPEKIIPAEDRYAAILDCVSYALANTVVRYDRTMAHGLGRLRKDVSATFGRDAEWDGTPAVGVFEFLYDSGQLAPPLICGRAVAKRPGRSARRSLTGGWGNRERFLRTP